MTRSRPRAPAVAPLLVALALVASLTPGLAWSEALAGDRTCVGKGEFERIKSGMSIEKLGKVLHGQTPFAETAGKGKQRYRWYVACEAWQPDLDVAVRYLQPVVGRRTVTKKSLDAYTPAVG